MTHLRSLRYSFYSSKVSENKIHENSCSLFRKKPQKEFLEVREEEMVLLTRDVISLLKKTTAESEFWLDLLFLARAEGEVHMGSFINHSSCCSEIACTHA